MALQLLRTKPLTPIPLLCRGKIWLPFRRDQTKRYKMAPLILDPLRNKHKRNVPLFFGQPDKRHPIKQAPGSLSWAEPIFAAYEDKLKNEEAQEATSGEPHKLHAVQRQPTTLFGVHKRLKKIMKALGLHPDQVSAGQFVILQNSEEINEKLSEIKHLVRVQKITFPNGTPKDDSDLEHMYLTDKAQVIVRQKLHGIDVVDQRPEDEWNIEKDTLVRGNRKLVSEHRVNLKYFEPKYEYRFNQDDRTAMSDRNSKMFNIPLSSDSESEPQTMPPMHNVNDNLITKMISTLDPDSNPDDDEEKQKLAKQLLELQNTLEDLSQRVDSVKEENLKLRSENQVLGQYIENLMAASSVFQPLSPKTKKKNTRRKERKN